MRRTSLPADTSHPKIAQRLQQASSVPTFYTSPKTSLPQARIVKDGPTGGPQRSIIRPHPQQQPMIASSHAQNQQQRVMTTATVASSSRNIRHHATSTGNSSASSSSVIAPSFSNNNIYLPAQINYHDNPASSQSITRSHHPYRRPIRDPPSTAANYNSPQSLNYIPLPHPTASRAIPPDGITFVSSAQEDHAIATNSSIRYNELVSLRKGVKSGPVHDALIDMPTQVRSEQDKFNQSAQPDLTNHSSPSDPFDARNNPDPIADSNVSASRLHNTTIPDTNERLN